MKHKAAMHFVLEMILLTARGATTRKNRKDAGEIVILSQYYNWLVEKSENSLESFRKEKSGSFFFPHPIVKKQVTTYSKGKSTYIGTINGLGFLIKNIATMQYLLTISSEKYQKTTTKSRTPYIKK